MVKKVEMFRAENEGRYFDSFQEAKACETAADLMEVCKSDFVFASQSPEDVVRMTILAVVKNADMAANVLRNHLERPNG